MMASITDIAGVNSISAQILANAAAAMAGMVEAFPVALDGGRPISGASMFGDTTACVDACPGGARGTWLRSVGLSRDGHGRKGDGKARGGGLFDGVLDITTTEMGDEMGGGVF